MGDQLERASLEGSAWCPQRGEPHEKPSSATPELLLCSVQVSGHCSGFSSFFVLPLALCTQLDAVTTAVEKRLQILPKSEGYSEEEQK